MISYNYNSAVCPNKMPETRYSCKISILLTQYTFFTIKTSFVQVSIFKCNGIWKINKDPELTGITINFK